MKVGFVLLLALVVLSCSAQSDYNPGTTIMVKDWFIFKVKDVIVPDIMKEFQTIKLPDTGYNETHYELMIYDMETDIVPLSADDIEVITDEAKNTLTVTIKNFHIQFIGNAMARFYFMHAHGEAILEATIDTVSFTVEPKLRQVNASNAIDYDLRDVTMKAGKIDFKKLQLGIIPESILEFVVNAILEACTFIFNEFSGILDTVIVKVVDTWKFKAPVAKEIPGTDFSVSLSFPNVPRLKADRIELPLDGTIFITSEGYDPHEEYKDDIPAYDPEDSNNLQVHLHEYVINTALSAVQKDGAYLTVDKDFLKPLNLPVDIMTTTYIGHLFPKTLCAYGKDKEMTLHIGIKQHDDTSLHFSKGRIYGDFIPEFSFYVGDDFAFSFDITLNLDANLAFTIDGDNSTITGTVNDLSLINPTFNPGKVEKADLPDIINKFEPMASAAATSAINDILSAGFTIPVTQLFQGLFELDLEKVYVELENKYVEVTFTIAVSDEQT